MGTRSGSPLGDMKGKVGTINLTTWKGIWVVKSLPRKTKKVSSEQQCQRSIFRTVTRFLERASSTIKLGYQLPPKPALSEMNMATSHTMLNAVVGEYPDYGIDLSKLKFSKPIRSIESGWNTNFTMAEDLSPVVTWGINLFPDKATRWDDTAIIVIYDGIRQIFFTKEGLERRALKYSFVEGDRIKFAGHEICCWLFFRSADGRYVSETEYLGMIKMPAIE